jgi:hypothetical protein
LGDDLFDGLGDDVFGGLGDDVFGGLDDFFGDFLDDLEDLFGGGGGLSYSYMFLEGFQDARGLLGAIPPNPSFPDEFDAGATYIYDKEPVYSVFSDFSGNATSGFVVDEADEIGTVTGKCIRTDPFDELDAENYDGRAYCQFVYSFGDVDELTAEGPIKIGEEAVLVVTGGTQMFRRTVGEIILTPVAPDPLPSIEFSLGLDLSASYYMEAFIYMDSDLVTSLVR